jgi:dihydrofolate reductase
MDDPPTRTLIYSMGVSLDGYIAGPGGEIGWGAPDEELHGFHNLQAREASMQLYGRRLYETMLPWADPERLPGSSEAVLEFARIWRDTPKLVFSRTLAGVQDGFELAGADAVATVAELKRTPGGELACGGAGLASSLAAAGMIDEYRVFVSPVLLGGGTPYLRAELRERLDLELLEQRRFGTGVVYLRYRSR